MRLIFFFRNTPNLTYFQEMQIKSENKVSVSEMSALEPVAITSPDSNEIAGYQQSMC